MLEYSNKHGDFFLLVNQESQKIKEIQHNVLILLRYLKSIIETMDEESLNDLLKRVRFSVVYPRAKDLKRFYYGPFLERFPDPAEREPIEEINTGLVEGYYLLIAAKVDTEVVGGIVYSLFSRFDVTFGVVYWVCVSKRLKEKGLKFVGTRLTNVAINDLKSRVVFSGKGLGGVFLEINDPQKMTHAEIEEDTLHGMDPNKRIEFWRRLDAKKLFKGYVQLTSNPKNYVYYCSLYLIPASPKWASGVSRDDLYKVLLTFQLDCNDYNEKFLAKYKPWLDMVKALQEKEFYRLE